MTARQKPFVSNDNIRFDKIYKQIFRLQSPIICGWNVFANCQKPFKTSHTMRCLSLLIHIWTFNKCPIKTFVNILEIHMNYFIVILRNGNVRTLCWGLLRQRWKEFVKWEAWTIMKHKKEVTLLTDKAPPAYIYTYMNILNSLIIWFSFVQNTHETATVPQTFIFGVIRKATWRWCEGKLQFSD